METDKGFTSIGNRVLSKEDLEKLSDDVRTKYELFFSEFLELKALYETQQTNLDGFRTEYEQRISELTEKFQDESSKAQSAQVCVNELREQLDEARQDVIKLTESLKRNETELMECRKDKEDESLLLKMIDRRNKEKNDLQEKLKAMEKDHQDALDAAEQKYANEMILHSNDINAMARMKEEMSMIRQQFDQLKAARDAAEEKLESCQGMWKNKEATLQQEKCELEHRLEDLDKQNAALHDQINDEKHQELLRKVEIVNSLTDSNRVLREERDALQERVTKLEGELVSLQEKNHELEANLLVERSNKNSPDDWKRLQSERENLAKMLQQEKDLHKKTTDESAQLKQEKAKIEGENANLQKQIAQNQAEIKRLTDEMVQLRQNSIKVSQELLETRVQAENKEEELKKLNEEINCRESILNQIKEKEIQIRKIAKRYKDQYLELKTQIDSGSSGEQQSQNVDNTNADTIEDSVNQEQYEARIQELQQEIETIRSTNSQLQQSNEELQAAINKEESCKQLLAQAKNKIAQLNEKKEQLTKEINNRSDEHKQIIRGIKAQYDARIQRLEKENTDLVNEKSEFMQRLDQLHRQMGSSQMTSKSTTSTMEKIPSDTATRTANVKPQMIAGSNQQQSATDQPWRGGNNSSGETPFASIGPISVQSSRTAAVLPTTNVSNACSSATGNATALVSPQKPTQPQQQKIHTMASSQPSREAMLSSPTSSHEDSMQVVDVTAYEVIAVIPPQISSNKAESSFEIEEIDQKVGGEGSIQIVVTSGQQGQQIQQAVALVSPRIENQSSQNIQSFDNQMPSTSETHSMTQPTQIGSHQQASSSNTMNTIGSLKRPCDEEENSSTSNESSNIKDESFGESKTCSSSSSSTEVLNPKLKKRKISKKFCDFKPFFGTISDSINFFKTFNDSMNNTSLMNEMKMYIKDSVNAETFPYEAMLLIFPQDFLMKSNINYVSKEAMNIPGDLFQKFINTMYEEIFGSSLQISLAELKNEFKRLKANLKTSQRVATFYKAAKENIG